jgi:hypothetical protein
MAIATRETAPLAREVTMTRAGYKGVADRVWMLVDPTTKRFAWCLAVDALPAAAARCQKVLPSLVAEPPPPQELPP